MACQPCAASWLISIFLSLVSISPSSGFDFWGGDRTDLGYVCSQTRNPPRCFELFRLDYRSSATDIRGLTEIAIKLAFNKAQQLSFQMNYPGYNLGNNPGYNPRYNPGYNPEGVNPGYNPGYNPGGVNPGYNPSYDYGNDYGRGTGYNDEYAKYYKKAIEDLEKAKEYLSSGDYSKIPKRAKHALKQVRKCRNVLGDNGELELLIEMVKFSSKRLNREF